MVVSVDVTGRMFVHFMRCNFICLIFQVFRILRVLFVEIVFVLMRFFLTVIMLTCLNLGVFVFVVVVIMCVLEVSKFSVSLTDGQLVNCDLVFADFTNLITFLPFMVSLLMLDCDQIFHFLFTIFHVFLLNFENLVSLLFVDNFSNFTVDFFLGSMVMVAVVDNVVHDYTVNKQHNEISSEHASVGQREGVL